MEDVTGSSCHTGASAKASGAVQPKPQTPLVAGAFPPFRPVRQPNPILDVRPGTPKKSRYKPDGCGIY